MERFFRHPDSLTRQDIEDAVHRDNQEFTSFLSALPANRQAPWWSVPADIWKILLCSKYRSNELLLDVFSLLAYIRSSNTAPYTWHCSQAIPVPKNNGLIGLQGIRLIHLLEPLSKAFYKMLWNRTNHQTYHFATGCVHCRSRLQTILTHRTLHERLAKMKRPFSFSKLDVQNAFPSLSKDSACSYLQSNAQPCDISLFCQRILQARMCIDTQEQETLVLAPGSGTLPGDTFAANLYCAVANPALGSFVNDCHLSSLLKPLTSQLEQETLRGVGTTVYVDDVGHTQVEARNNTMHLLVDCMKR